MKRTWRYLKKFFTVFFVLLLIFFSLNSLFPLRSNLSWSTVITDKNGVLLGAFLSNDDKWRMKVRSEEVNAGLKNILINKEDRFFYYHPGVNPVAIIRAAFNNTISGRKTSGASTITMQVARLLYPAKRTYLNKCIEIFRSFQLEWKYSKEEIFNLYLSLLPYGGNVEGVKAASLFYFGVKPENINLSQAVILSIIPNRPGSLNPKKGIELIHRERDRFLIKLQAQKLFSDKIINEAILEPVIMERHSLPAHSPHLSFRLHDIYPLNDVIKTTVDSRLQEKAAAIAYNKHKKLKLLNIKNLAVLVIENATAKVRAYVGSQDFNDALNSGQVDGIRAVRSPGSTLKPLVYAMAIDHGMITPKTILNDVPVNISGYAPENFNSNFNGLISAENALALSLNIPAVDLLNQVGISEFSTALKKAGFKTIAKTEKDLGLSMILGGCGTSLEELAALYTSFANGGEYMPLKFLEDDPSGKKIKVITASSAFMITEMLTRLIRPDLPNNWESSIHVPKIAWKTGTSYGRRDAWSIGYNKKYTIAVWTGNFNGEGVPELTGADMSTPLLFDLFNALDYDSGDSWYVAPKELDYRLVCTSSGLLPGTYCTDLVTDYYLPAVSTTSQCQFEKEISISADGFRSYCMICRPENGFKKEIFSIFPPSVNSFYTYNGINFRHPPPHNPECSRVFSGQGPEITSPIHSKEYLLERDAGQQLLLKSAAGADIQWVYWYINDHFYQKTKTGQSVYFTPSQGLYKISCSDDKGRNTDCEIEVKFY